MSGTGEGSGRTRAAFAVYRGLGRALQPFAGLWLRNRAGRGKEITERVSERLGIASVPRPDGPLIWLHAASVGELNSVLPLTGRLRALGLQTVVTTGTVTSAKIAAERLPTGAIHQFQALDLPAFTRRFLDHWRPDLAVFVESEIWPTTLHELGERGILQLMVNARMSDRSFERWAKRHRIARDVFGRLGHVVAQSDVDAERYRALGSPRVATSGNLKADVTAPAFDESELRALRMAIGKRPVWVAASLHPAEDAAIADAVALLTLRRPDALAVVVPRHPERGADMCAMLRARGISVAQRSKGEAVTSGTQVLLGDTLGEMGLWYRLAPIAFVGRSLSPDSGAHGGQNPIEPALCGAAVLSGRSVANFREPYHLLLTEGGARFVDDAAQLADFVAHLWDDPQALARMQQGGRSTVERMAGALDRTLVFMEPWLAPLRMQAMLERTRSVSEGHVAGLSEARLRAIHDAEIAGRVGPLSPLAQRLTDDRGTGERTADERLAAE